MTGTPTIIQSTEVKWGTSSSAYSNTLPCTSLPEISTGTAEQVETTLVNVTDRFRTFVNGMNDSQSVTFECRYEAAEFKKLYDAKDDPVYFEITYPKSDDTSGSGAKVTFKANISLTMGSGGASELATFSVVANISGEVTWAEES